jgi:hypothetical protein
MPRLPVLAVVPGFGAHESSIEKAMHAESMRATPDTRECAVKQNHTAAAEDAPDSGTVAVSEAPKENCHAAMLDHPARKHQYLSGAVN